MSYSSTKLIWEFEGSYLAVMGDRITEVWHMLRCQHVNHMLMHDSIPSILVSYQR